METIARTDHAVNRSSDLTDRSPSASLAAANARLLALRQQHKAKQAPVKKQVPVIAPVECEVQPKPQRTWLSSLKEGLEKAITDATASVEEEQPTLPKIPQTLRIIPDTLVTLLKQEQVAAGRIWLLARALDSQGRGWLSVDTLRASLTTKGSELKVCGWRRLRQILQSGEGVFWQRDKIGRIWLTSQIKLAIHFGITRFTSDPVVIDVSNLLGKIGDVRAFFYKGFHFDRKSTPISRETLRDVTGVAERTQRLYDDFGGIERIRNFHLTQPVDSQESAWRHRHAAFQFTDKQGRHGEAGRTYTAIRLPNSYRIDQPLTDGRKKNCNRRLKQALAKSGTQGNSSSYREQLFFTDGKQFARKMSDQQDSYLQTHGSKNITFWNGFFCDDGRK